MITQPTPSTRLSPKTGDDCFEGILPTTLDAGTIRTLAQIDNLKASFAISSEWVAIIGAITLSHHFWHPLFYISTVIFIGARQHALAVLQHDAAHYRLFSHRRWNDWVAELLLAWPILLSNQRFREYHFLHHRYTGAPKDGNRTQYQTHTPEGDLTSMWTFPKGKLRLMAWLLLRVSGFAGFIYILRSTRRLFTYGSLTYRLLNLLYYLVIVGLFFVLHGDKLLWLYWFVPLITWFMMTNLLRIAGEHSALPLSESVYQLSRTTLPSWFDRLFMVPRNISYHLEHHLYPHIPFYRLPDLHRRLMDQEPYRQQAPVAHSYWQVLQTLSNQPKAPASQEDQIDVS